MENTNEADVNAVLEILMNDRAQLMALIALVKFQTRIITRQAMLLAAFSNELQSRPTYTIRHETVQPDSQIPAGIRPFSLFTPN